MHHTSFRVNTNHSYNYYKRLDHVVYKLGSDQPVMGNVIIEIHSFSNLLPPLKDQVEICYMIYGTCGVFEMAFLW